MGGDVEHPDVPAITARLDDQAGTLAVTAFSDGLNRYLQFLELPTEHVLASTEERGVVINNLPGIVKRIPIETRAQAMYLSKFVAACGVGLFDAALNMIWNEVIVSLRMKVARFDLDYFLDSVITDAKRRSSLRTEEDLRKLEDWELIKGSRDTGIVSDVGYKHLDYIRDMRNHISAAHPNVGELDGLQLASWLQTCITEVLAKEPEGPVLEIRRLLANLRGGQLTQSDVPPVTATIRRTPPALVDSLLRALFGMYTDPDVAALVRNNVNLLAPEIWGAASTAARQEAALKYAVFSANADLPRKQLGHEFLTIVSGLSLLPDSQKALEIDQALDDLFRVHNGWNNFFAEGPLARSVAAYIPDTGEVPKEVFYKYVKVLVMCRIGNGYGVSESAKPFYDDLIQRFSDLHFIATLQLFEDRDVSSRLQLPRCADEFRKLAAAFRGRAVKSSVKAALRNVADYPGKLAELGNTTKFIDAVRLLSS
ncbi:MAG: hypothetical protein ACYCO4_00275 [Sulfobacillus sp.]